MGHYRYLINKKNDFEALVDFLHECPLFAYDTETNGKFKQTEVQLVGISFGFDLFSCYIPLTHVEGEQLDPGYVLGRLRSIFEDPSKTTIAHNAKFDEMVLKVHGISAAGSGDDTYIMAWLLREDAGSKGLKALTKEFLGISMETYEDVISTGPKKRGIARDYNFAKVSLANALSYAGDDAYYTYQLFKLFYPSLTRQGLHKPYARIERAFSRVLGEIENHGVCVDLDYLEYADKELPKIAEQVEGEIYEEAGEVFKITSPKQLGRVLYEKLGVGKNVPKTSTGNYATDKKTLSNYADNHRIVKNILRRKKIQKTHSTFVVSIKDFIEKDGKVHPSFNGCGTRTGRLAGNSPNLQQIEGSEVESIKVRNFFIPEPGNVFVVSDYSQVELRVMAHFSRDEKMIEAFLKGRDFHEETAVGMLGIKGDVDRKARLIAKTINFGVGYGRGPNSIAEQLGISISEAEQFISQYFQNFPRLSVYKDWLIKDARKKGYIRTISGRKRRLLPNIRSSDWKLRGAAERQAFNTKIQGSAADIIKVAMISLAPELKPFDAHMVIQIHDELVVECPREVSDSVENVVKEIMEHPINGKNPLRLPLVTEPSTVDRWGDAKE